MAAPREWVKPIPICLMNIRSQKIGNLLRVFLRENPEAKLHNHNQITSIAIEPRKCAQML